MEAGRDLSRHKPLGTVRLRNAQIAAREVGGPIEILSADLQFQSDKIRVTKIECESGRYKLDRFNRDAARLRDIVSNAVHAQR